MSALISAPSLCETNLTSYIFTPDAREMATSNLQRVRRCFCVARRGFTELSRPACHTAASVAGGLPTL